MDRLSLPIEEFLTALIQVDRIGAGEIFEECHLQNNSFEALEELTTYTLEQIGDRWENDQLSLSQVYMSGVICEELISKYLPVLGASYKNKPRIAIGVLQDYHALGKRIVYSALRAGGYDLIDFGQGLSIEELVEGTIAEKVDILLISVLMLPSALKVKQLVEMLRQRGSAAKVIVGGAPFRLDQELWKQVHADAYGRNGADVPAIIDILMKGAQS